MTVRCPAEAVLDVGCSSSSSQHKLIQTSFPAEKQRKARLSYSVQISVSGRARARSVWRKAPWPSAVV